VTKNYAGPSAGGNRLNQKHNSDKIKVAGMAMTKQQKKQLLKKQKRMAMMQQESDDEDIEESKQ